MSLGRLLCERDAADEGLTYAEAALQTRREQFKAGHWLIGESELAVGQCLMAKKRFDEALVMLRHAYDVQLGNRSTRDDRPPNSATALAALYDAWGNRDQAAAWRAKAQ